MRKIEEAEVKNKKVLLRVDYNVPMKGRKVADTERIEDSKKTIDWLRNHDAIVVICAHFGRPEGKKNKKYSFKPIVSTLAKVLGTKVLFVQDCIGDKRNAIVESAKPGDVLLLENVRFYAGEEENDPKFAQKLAQNCDLYVNEAFSNSHRNHASMTGVTKFLPSYAGFSLKNEVEVISKTFDRPKKPFVMISGGAKISDKIDFLKSVIKKIDVLILGGGMANTFLAAEGYEIGKSLYEKDFEDVAEEVKREAEDNGVEVILPDDVKVAKRISDWVKAQNKSIEEVGKSDIIVDIGTRSVGRFSEPLKFAGTIFWNGPMGIAEHKNFASGTIGIAKIVSESKAFSLIGGGDTVSAVKDLKLKFDFVSTGGGATLEFLVKGKLPAVEALK